MSTTTCPQCGRTVTDLCDHGITAAAEVIAQQLAFNISDHTPRETPEEEWLATAPYQRAHWINEGRKVAIALHQAGMLR